MSIIAASFVLALAQPPDLPELVRGHFETIGASHDLASDLRALPSAPGRPAWAGYAVPMVRGSHHLCGSSVVRLDGERRWEGTDGTEDEGEAATLFVMLRVERGAVTGLEVASPGCRIDAGSAKVYWLERVAPSESLAALEPLAASSDEDLRNEALRAIALHADAASDRILGRVAAKGASRDAREKAIFWLGAARGEGGLPKLDALLNDERDSELREKIVFSLHLSDVEGAVARLIAVARSDRDSEVRERALFWLAQRAGKVAASAIAEAVQDDPELEVKKKAVFALSQLPADEGVPLLIEVAETHREPAVRKSAFFWLGQSNDPRAVALFERVLLGRR
jgi:HEAT repeats